MTLTTEILEARADHALQIWIADVDCLAAVKAALAAGYPAVTDAALGAAEVAEARSKRTLKARIAAFNLSTQGVATVTPCA